MLFTYQQVLWTIFFQPHVDTIYNYGSLGAILDMKLCIVFDNYGAQFDHLGHLKNWWYSEQDYQKYNNEISKVKNHYGKLMLYGNTIDSDASLPENYRRYHRFKTQLENIYAKIYAQSGSKNLTTVEKKHLTKFFASWARTLRTVEAKK